MPKKNQDSQSDLTRRSPEEGGPGRITPDQGKIIQIPMPQYRQRVHDSPLKALAKRSLLKKALPYLIAGGSTGAGIGIGLKEFIL